jgi:hypothetical protein
MLLGFVLGAILSPCTGLCRLSQWELESGHICLQLRYREWIRRYTCTHPDLQIALAGGIGLAFNIFGRTPFHRAKDVDLYTDLDFFDALDDHYEREKEGRPIGVKEKILAKVFQGGEGVYEVGIRNVLSLQVDIGSSVGQ